MRYDLKKVFHVITTICRGGAENQLLILVKEQVKLGWEVHVIYLKDEPELRDKFEKLGVTIHKELADKSPLIQPLLLARIPGIKKSIVHAHLPRAEIVTFLSPVNFKLIISRHNSEPFYPGAPNLISKSLSKLVTTRAKKIIAISNAVAYFIKVNHEIINFDKIKVVHYGYIPNLFNIKNNSSPKKNTIRIGTISRLTSQKNLATMFHAVQKLKEQIDEVSLYIVGAGPLEFKLKKLALQLNLEKDIHFLGRSDKVLQFLQTLDVFILTSNYEGFGLVLLEAMDAGVPIVAANNSSIPEVLGKNFPGLCETLDSSDFANKILWMSEPQNRKKVLEIQMERLISFDANKMALNINEIYLN